MEPTPFAAKPRLGVETSTGLSGMSHERRKHMKPEVIEQSIQLWTKEPEKAKASPLVKARSEGAQAVLEAGPFSWQTDRPPTLGGENKAASPTALLLGALAGCAVVFIRDTLAPQLGVRVDSVQADVRCEADFRGLLAMPGTAPDIQDLEVNIQITSPESEEKVQRLYQAWLQRCPVYLALTKPLKIRVFADHSGSFSALRVNG
jgi:uncharacterized OsmC-like protein